MQSLSATLGGSKGGYWKSGPGMRKGGRRAVSLSLRQRWSGAFRGPGGWRPIRRGPWRAVVGLFVAGTALYGLSVGGHLERFAAQFAAETGALALRAGFTVQHLSIEGERRTSRARIEQALGIDTGASMLSIDTAAAQARLEALAWVRQVRIMRLLPSTLHIAIEERTPFAVWQRDGRFALVDAEGAVLGPLGEEDPSGLPLIVGEGAPAAAPALFRALSSHRDLRAQLRAAVRVADRRWNLKLASGAEVRLPEEHVARALDKLADLDRTDRILSGDVEAVDLRLADRITLRLTETAAARWSDAIERGQAGRDASARDT